MTSTPPACRDLYQPGKRSIDIKQWQNRTESTGGRGSHPLHGIRLITDLVAVIVLVLRLTERTWLQTKTLRRAAGARYLGTRNAATAIQMVLLARLRDENRIGCGLNP